MKATVLFLILILCPFWWDRYRHRPIGPMPAICAFVLMIGVIVTVTAIAIETVGGME